MTRTFEEKRAQRERDILQAARLLVREKGYAQMNMDELAECVGISKPTLYQHFPTKEALVATAMLHSAQALERFMFSLQHGTPIERLEQVYRHVIHNEISQGFSTSMRDMQTMLQTHAQLWAVFQRTGGMLYALIQEGKIQGQIVPHLHTHAIIGMMFTSLYLLDDADFARATAEGQQAIIESMVHIFLNGIRA